MCPFSPVLCHQSQWSPHNHVRCPETGVFGHCHQLPHTQSHHRPPQCPHHLCRREPMHLIVSWNTPPSYQTLDCTNEYHQNLYQDLHPNLKATPLTMPTRPCWSQNSFKFCTNASLACHRPRGSKPSIITNSLLGLASLPMLYESICPNPLPLPKAIWRKHQPACDPCTPSSPPSKSSCHQTWSFHQMKTSNFSQPMMTLISSHRKKPMK